MISAVNIELTFLYLITVFSITLVFLIFFQKFVSHLVQYHIHKNSMHLSNYNTFAVLSYEDYGQDPIWESLQQAPKVG